MAMRVDLSTFVPDEDQCDYCIENGHTDGLVQVEIGGRARMVETRIYAEGHWIIRGLLVTFPGTTRSWSAAVHYMPTTGLMWVRSNYAVSRHPMPIICGFVEDLHDQQINARRKYRRCG